MTIWNPTACQIDMSMTAGRASAVSPSQSTGFTAPNVMVPIDAVQRDRPAGCR